MNKLEELNDLVSTLTSEVVSLKRDLESWKSYKICQEKTLAEQALSLRCGGVISNELIRYADIKRSIVSKAIQDKKDGRTSYIVIGFRGADDIIRELLRKSSTGEDYSDIKVVEEGDFLEGIGQWDKEAIVYVYAISERAYLEIRKVIPVVRGTVMYGGGIDCDKI